jgi:hypothetical protein
VPPKLSHLIWRILNNALPVKSNLVKRDIRIDPLCPWCYSHVETPSHVFLECDWAKQVWLASPLTLNLHHNPISEISEWIHYQITNLDKESMEKVIAILYYIWYARNQKLFQDKQIPQNEISNKSLNLLMEYQQHNSNPDKA